MTLGFDGELADALRVFAESVRNSTKLGAEFRRDPTSIATNFLSEEGLDIPFGFHAHVIGSLAELPDEPKLATRERYIYIYDKGGEFQYKRIPGSANGNDDMFLAPKGACECCNCCVVVL